MEGSKMNDECPQLLDLMIPRDRDWVLSRDHEQKSHGSSEERKLELRLGPPGEDWSMEAQNSNKNREESLFSLGYFSTQNFVSADNKQKPWDGSKAPITYNLPFPSPPPKPQSQAQHNCTKIADQSSAEKKKAFSISPAPANNNNTAVPNTSQKRTAPAPVVGWPPIRSFRKNLASSSSSKPAAESSQNAAPSKVSPSEKPAENCKKGLFVKINMDGVPIGRKVDLKAYDSYEKLSVAVDELFRGLLAAQRDSSAGGIKNKQEEEKPITGVLDGSGEYTLVYEDNEGDRMLAGDVPWHMFVSTVKRLRVLKSSELSALSLGNKQHKTALHAA